MVNVSDMVNIDDLRLAARRRLPRAVFDYIDGGAEAEVTLRENCRPSIASTFRPRCAVATPACDLKTKVLGTPLAMPFMLGPVGSCRMFYPRGEEVAARAAGAAGTLYTLSTLSGCRLEDVAKATTRSRLVSGVPVRRPRRRDRHHRAGAQGRVTPRWC